MNFLHLAPLLIACSLFSCQAKLIIFGDSLSDNGVDGILAANELINNYFSSGPVNVGVYPPAPYYKGRFTNGFIWVDVAAAVLGQEVDNYACGGSNGNTGEVSVEPPFAYVTTRTPIAVRSLVEQAEAYAALNANAAPGSTDTVVIFAGYDEYQQKLQGVSSGPPDISDVLSAINNTMGIAATAGVKNFVVFNLPPISSAPFAATVDKNSVDTLTSDHNSQLDTALASFNSSYPGTSTLLYNVNALLTSLITSPASFGAPAFTNTTGACRGGSDVSTSQAASFSIPNCPDGDAYVFWDSTHPTKRVHQLIGQDFAAKTGSKTSATLVQSSS